LAAVVGVLGGMGGAFIGGYVANEGQQQRFKEEQSVRFAELRRDTFAEYMRAIQGVISGAHRETLFTPEAKVELVARSDEVREAAAALAKAAGVEIRRRDVRGRFIEAAKAELKADE
jgi:hypothetical protein